MNRNGNISFFESEIQVWSGRLYDLETTLTRGASAHTAQHVERDAAAIRQRIDAAQSGLQRAREAVERQDRAVIASQRGAEDTYRTRAVARPIAPVPVATTQTHHHQAPTTTPSRGAEERPQDRFFAEPRETVIPYWGNK